MDNESDFQLETFETDDGSTGIRVSGDLDRATADQLLGAIQSWPKPVERCVIDLTHCTFVDSSGIRALLLGTRELDGGNPTMRLTGVSPYIGRVLTIAGVHTVLEIDTE